MALIPCPVCSKDVSPDAATCPNCGHPIASQSAPKSQPIIVQRGSSGILGGFAVLLIIVVMVAAVTKPSEAALRNALLERYGLMYGAGAVAEKMGVMNVTYHDRLVFSTLSIQLPLDSERTVAVGLFGQHIIPDSVSTLRVADTTKHSRETETRATNPTPQMPAPAAVAEAPVGPGSLSPQQIHAGLKQVYGLMKNEMYAAAVNAARQRHPASNFVGNGCIQKSLTTEAYREIRWTYQGIYRCQMKGAVIGISNFDFRVRVEGEVDLQNGTFVPKIVDTAILD